MNSSLIDSNLLLVLLGGVSAILGLGLSIYGIFTWLKRGKKISDRLEQFVAPKVQTSDGPNANRIIPREIRGSLINRTIMNWFRNFLKFLGRFTPDKMAADMEHQLTIAGNPSNFHAREFFAIRILVFVAGVFLAFLINRDFDKISMNSVLIGLMAVVVFLALPGVWLKGQVRIRQEEIRRGLPDALDMLSVCASAGLGFDQSLQKISSYWETELGLELKRITQEMEMGVSRTIALRNLSIRLDVDDLSRFISLIIQAEKVGMSYADVLHSQAIQMRVQRQYRAKGIANKLPGKMILPIALMIFPAMIAVILGPSIPILLNLF